ncbi:MAG: hypothetical protein G01um101431_683 [Parcubacteria group bacterium Gr01-1014_31]|nr:MAG: hypothetical protein G01um101431_683 [Parcubacteria group bacterium Gr01-1014_31]
MNAGGVSKACKSNESAARRTSGERVSNTLVTCPEVRNNQAKAWLIPDVIRWHESAEERRKPLQEGPMAYQLVGEVMAHQGYDE